MLLWVKVSSKLSALIAWAFRNGRDNWIFRACLSSDGEDEAFRPIKSHSYLREQRNLRHNLQDNGIFPPDSHTPVY